MKQHRLTFRDPSRKSQTCNSKILILILLNTWLAGVPRKFWIKRFNKFTLNSPLKSIIIVIFCIQILKKNFNNLYIFD